MSSTNTSGQSNGLGAKIKGGIQAIHGLGENIRGTALGALDTMSEGHETQNDEIARKGRVETEAGLAKWKGQPAPALNTAGGATGTTNPAQASGTSDTTATNPPAIGAGVATTEAGRDGLAKVNSQPTNRSRDEQASAGKRVPRRRPVQSSASRYESRSGQRNGRYNRPQRAFQCHRCRYHPGCAIQKFWRRLPATPPR